MDALRRAEAEKAAARGVAAGGAEEPPPDTGGGLRLEPLPEAGSETPFYSSISEAVYAAYREPTTRGYRAEHAAPASGDPDTLAFGLDEDRTPSAERLTVPTGSLARPAIATAQTVFEANARSGAPRLLAVVIGFTLIVAASLTAVGVYYYRQAPVPPPLPSPRIAQTVEKPMPADVAVDRRGADAAPTARIAGPVEAVGRSALPGAPSAAGEVAADRRGADATSTARIAEPAEAVRGSAVSGAMAAAGVAAPARDAEIVQGDIHIARRAGDTGANDRLQRAYAAYTSGDLVAARRLYEAALAAAPRQPDALLGLAALALRGQRLSEAHRLYRDVLNADPGNAVATAALFMIEGGQGSELTPARLQLLLDEGAASPYVQFALGNLRAREQRWADAQQAFFEAHRGAPDNADYAYNLAVSLERLGQHAAALDYYRKALTLAARGGASFNPKTAAARIDALAAAPP